MPMRGELPPVAARSYVRAVQGTSGRSWFVAMIASSELQAIAAFCTIGFLVTINAVLLFPNFGATVARLALFP